MSNLNRDCFDSICRVCTSQLNGTQAKSIFDIFVSASKTLEFCLRIRVDKDEADLPKHVCDPCVTKLQDFESFRKSCSEQQSKLRQCLASSSTNDDSKKNGDDAIKEEADKPMTDEDDSDDDEDDDEDANKTTSTDALDTSDDKSGTEGDANKLPELSDPTPEDYVLMKEESFQLNPAQQSSILGDYLVEFSKSNGTKKPPDDNKDRDLMEIQKLRKEILPPMWDVFEKASSTSEAGMINVTHRRYIVAKNAFPCSLCGECFEFDQGKSRVLSESRDEKNKLYDCHVCGKVFPRRGSWRRHLSTHENIKPYVCRVCWTGFNLKEHLRDHLSTHGTSRPFSCDSCKKQFVRNEHLARHKLCSPSCSTELASPLFETVFNPGIDVVRPFQCDVCNQGFVRKEHLVRHRKRAHDLDPPEGAEAKPFSCSVCSKTFTRREHLRRHQQIHARELLQSSMDMAALTGLNMGPELPFPASLMPEISLSTPGSAGSGNSSPSVKKEGDDVSDADAMEVDVDPSTSSPQLNRVSPSALAAVSATLAGIPVAVREKLMRPIVPRERPPKPIPKCDVCHKVFSRRSHLLRHLKRLHNIDPPPTVRGRHLRPEDENHNKQQQYECVTCGEAFTESEKLNQHMETHGNTIMNNFNWM
uniref:Zinc finger protein 347 n=1 Tax=Cacopsylla melanoneura TaxID=428564 RepID=A0A8D8V4W3_9HEMI